MILNLDQISTFLAVYQLGSYMKAADYLYLPQPTVSNRIKQLETELGQPLFIRDKRGVTLTEEGRTFLPYAQKMVSSYEEGKEAVSRLKQGLQGKLTIGCNNSFAGSALPSVMESFIDRYPDVDIQILSYSSKDQIRRMKEREFQVGITRYTVNDPHLTFRQVHSEDVKLIVSPLHPFAKSSEIPIGDILNQKLILYQPDTLYRKMIDVSLSRYNLQYDLKYETNNMHLIKNMVIRNFGVFFSGPLFVQDELLRGDVAAIDIVDNPFPESNVFLMYRSEDLNSLDHLFMAHFQTHMERLRTAYFASGYK